ncbi:MAG: NAD(P)/FAD-dependent oxidoreductase [Saprospiraceae bacterium]
MKVLVIGGGAAGFFSAIQCAELNPAAEVTVLERGSEVLQKVRISGGGRCNVTHACFEPRELIHFYPRGSRELLGPFTQFNPTDTIEWFEGRGVPLKTESDGRMFPVSDDSASIVRCLETSAQKAGVTIRTRARVDRFEPIDSNRWLVILGNGERLQADKLLVATGSSTSVWKSLAQIGHSIIEPVPSLFTFNTKDTRLRGLAGVSAPHCNLQIDGMKLSTEGPVLVTHWGLSGPAILRLSAWGARQLHEVDYTFPLTIDWTGLGPEAVLDGLMEYKEAYPKRKPEAHALFDLPMRLWQNLVPATEKRWADYSKRDMETLHAALTKAVFPIHGKSTFKEEFVTAGGVDLKEINFKRFESKIHPNLFMAGEVLDIDAITGGFNFQAAWTGGWLAGQAMAW